MTNEMKITKELMTFHLIQIEKMMTSINIINGKQIAIVKGAPDVLLSKCKNVNLKELKEINNK